MEVIITREQWIKSMRTLRKALELNVISNKEFLDLSKQLIELSLIPDKID